MSWKKIGYWYKSFVKFFNISDNFVLKPKDYTKNIKWNNPKVFSSSSNIIYKIHGVIDNKVTKINNETFKIDKYTTNIGRQNRLTLVQLKKFEGVGVTSIGDFTYKIQLYRFHPILKFLIFINNSVSYSTWNYYYSPSHKRDLLPYKIKFYKEGEINNPIFVIHEGLIWDVQENRQYDSGKDITTFKLMELKNLEQGIYCFTLEFSSGYHISNPEDRPILSVNGWNIKSNIFIDNLFLGDKTYYTDNIIYAYDEK